MARLAIKKITALDGTFEATLYTERDEYVLVTDEAKIPGKYMQAKEFYEPRKADIKAAIKRGEIVPGVEIKKNDRLTIKG